MKPKETIIEASNIYFGGGFILLKLLVDKLEAQKNYTIVFLKYKDVLRAFSEGDYRYVSFIRTTSSGTLFRYFLRRNKILFFCNLPPFRKQQRSLLYFHNPHFSKRPVINLRSVLTPGKLKHYLYYHWIKFFAKNVDIVGCQTSAIMEDLQQTGIQAVQLPFFGIVKPGNEDVRYDFCYVSTAAPHKNHKILFEAVKILATSIDFNIAVTINHCEANNELLQTIDDINKELGKDVIINAGRLERNDVIDLYCQSRALVFPSLTETFGLPLIEALQCNLTILASDKPFTHNVVENAIVFDPADPYSIADQMKGFLEGRFESIKQKILVDNKIDEIIKLLNN